MKQGRGGGGSGGGGGSVSGGGVGGGGGGGSTVGSVGGFRVDNFGDAAFMRYHIQHRLRCLRQGLPYSAPLTPHSPRGPSTSVSTTAAESCSSAGAAAAASTTAPSATLGANSSVAAAVASAFASICAPNLATASVTPGTMLRSTAHRTSSSSLARPPSAPSSGRAGGRRHRTPALGSAMSPPLGIQRILRGCPPLLQLLQLEPRARFRLRRVRLDLLPPLSCADLSGPPTRLRQHSHQTSGGDAKICLRLTRKPQQGQGDSGAAVQCDGHVAQADLCIL